jgi:N-acetylmuramoyl-L-alanine amidase
VDSRGKGFDNRTQGQKDALSMVLHEWRAKYPTAKILGHRDFPKVAKACPSFDAVAEYAHI